MSYEFEWNGDEILVRVDRAIGRAVIGIGERVAVRAKEIVHVETGTLRRSIHVAVPGTDHAEDEVLSHGSGPAPHHVEGVYVSDVPGSTQGLDLAAAYDPLLTPELVEAGHEHIAIVEVGSWVAYACVEECGRQHHFILPAADEVVPTGWETIEQAFIEEGLL